MHEREIALSIYQLFLIFHFSWHLLFVVQEFPSFLITHFTEKLTTLLFGIFLCFHESCGIFVCLFLNQFFTSLFFFSIIFFSAVLGIWGEGSDVHSNRFVLKESVIW